MDETKPEDKQVPTPTQAPAPMTGQISSQMPKRTKARLVAQTAIIVILILGIAGAVWYWFNVYQKPAPVVEQVKVEEPEEEPITLTTKYFGYALGEDSIYTAYDINPETGKLTQIFKTPDKYQNIAATTKDAIYYLKNGVNGIGNHSEIIKYNIANKKETVITAADKKGTYMISAKMSPDGTRIAFSEICNVDGCTEGEGGKINTLKIIDLSDDSVKTIYSKTTYGSTQPFGISSWENSSYLKLFDYCECDGGINANQTKIINVNSGAITEINLTEEFVSNTSISPDSKKIAYVYFNGDTETQKFTSGLKVKDISTGEIETISESTKEAYERVNWVSDTQLVVIKINAVKVGSGLGDQGYPSGEYTIALHNYGGADKEIKSVTDKAEYILFGRITPEYIFYSTIANPTPSTSVSTNYALNLKTKEVVKLLLPINNQLSY